MKNDLIDTFIIAVICLMLMFFGIRGLVKAHNSNNEVVKKEVVSQPINIKELGTSYEEVDRHCEIYTLEGCEYIVVSPGNSHYTWGTHKGNCKNPIHKK